MRTEMDLNRRLSIYSFYRTICSSASMKQQASVKTEMKLNVDVLLNILFTRRHARARLFNQQASVKAEMDLNRRLSIFFFTGLYARARL